MRTVRYASVLLLLSVFLLSACTGDDDDEFPSAPGFQEPGATATATATTPAADAGATPQGSPGDDDDDDTGAVTPPPVAAADNVFRVSDAGEVELAVDGNRLVLVDVRPNDGWSHRIDENDDDEIEIDFRDNGREIDFEAELDDGWLKIDVCDTVVDPQGDVYQVGDAGEVEVRRGTDDDDDDGGSTYLELLDVRPNDGWTHEVEDDDDDEIEVVFRSGDREVKFDLEVDDGRAEAKICTRTVFDLDNGQLPASGAPVTDDHQYDDDDDGDQDDDDDDDQDDDDDD